jgi:hypothetical protein
MWYEGHVERMGEKRNAYWLLVGKPEWKREYWEDQNVGGDNIKINLGETGWCGIDWIYLAQDKNQWWVKGSYEHAYQLSCSIKYYVLDQMHNYRLLKKG